MLTTRELDAELGLLYSDEGPAALLIPRPHGVGGSQPAVPLPNVVRPNGPPGLVDRIVELAALPGAAPDAHQLHSFPGLSGASRVPQDLAWRELWSANDAGPAASRGLDLPPSLADTDSLSQQTATVMCQAAHLAPRYSHRRMEVGGYAQLVALDEASEGRMIGYLRRRTEALSSLLK